MYCEHVDSWWAVYGFGWGNVRGGAESGEEEVSMCRGLLSEMERGRKTRSG